MLSTVNEQGPCLDTEKFQNLKEKEKILEDSLEKKIIFKQASGFLLGNIKSQKTMKHYFKVLKSYDF